MIIKENVVADVNIVEKTIKSRGVYSKFPKEKCNIPPQKWNYNMTTQDENKGLQNKSLNKYEDNVIDIV